MTVQALFDLHKTHTEFLAEQQSIKLRKRKFGFTFEEVFDQHAEIIQAVVLNRIVAINQHRSPGEPVRRPHWLSAAEFSSFISKIAVTCVR